MERSIKLNELQSFVASFTTSIHFDWKVSVENFIQTNMVLGTLNTPKEKYNIISHMPGTIKSLPKSSDDTTPITVIECDHDTSFGNLCINCGEIPKNREHKAYVGLHSGVSFSQEKALKEEKKFMEKLFESKRLMLVLDIDHTLVHSCSSTLVDPNTINDCEKFIDKSGYSYIIKFRPFLEAFMKDIGPLFDTYIYSHGSQKYANRIANLIDPKEITIKQTKVLGREEREIDLKLKNLENLLPANQTASIIIDDRNDVWANKSNLIMIFPYVHFDTEYNSYDRNIYSKLPGNSQDCSLFYFGKLLKNIHSLFFDAREKNIMAADVRNIIRFIRAYILKSVTVNLSLLGKRQEKLCNCAEYKMALEMGAIISDEITSDTILLAWKYKEVKEAKVVSVDWLVLSSRYWRKLPLDPFILSKDLPKATINEFKLVEEMEGSLEKKWKCEYYDEILKGLLENEQEINNNVTKRKKEDTN